MTQLIKTGPTYNSGSSGSGRFTLKPDSANTTQTAQTKTITVTNSATGDAITFTFIQKALGIVFGIDGWDGSSNIYINVPSSQGITQTLYVTTPNDLQVQHLTGSEFTTPSVSTITIGQNKPLSFNYSENDSGSIRVDVWKVGSANIIITQAIGAVSYDIYTTVPTYVYRTDKVRQNFYGQDEPEIMGKTELCSSNELVGNFIYKLSYTDYEDSLTGEIPITFGWLNPSFYDEDEDKICKGPQHIYNDGFVFDKTSQNQTYSHFDAEGTNLEYENGTLSKSSEMIVVNSEGREYIPYNFNNDSRAMNHITKDAQTITLYAIDDFFECQKHYIPVPYNPFNQNSFARSHNVSIITAHCNASTYIPFTDSKYSYNYGRTEDFNVTIIDSPNWITKGTISNINAGSSTSDTYRAKKIELNVSSNTSSSNRTALVEISRSYTYNPDLSGQGNLDDTYAFTYTISTRICINQLGTGSTYYAVTFNDEQFGRTGYCPSGIVQAGYPLYLKACNNILDNNILTTGLPDRYIARSITYNSSLLSNIIASKNFQDTNFYESFVSLATNSMSENATVSSLVNKICEENIGYVIQSGGFINTSNRTADYYPNRILYNIGEDKRYIYYPGDGTAIQNDIIFYSAKGLNLQLVPKLNAVKNGSWTNINAGSDEVIPRIEYTSNPKYELELRINRQYTIGTYDSKIYYKFVTGSNDLYLANVFGLVYEVNTVIPE